MSDRGMSEDDMSRFNKTWESMTPGQRAIIEDMKVQPMRTPGTSVTFSVWWDMNKRRIFREHPYIIQESLKDIMEEAWLAGRANT